MQGTVPIFASTKMGLSLLPQLTGPDAMRFFTRITDLDAGAELLRRRAYGVIEMVDGRLSQVRFRPYPKIISAPKIAFFGNLFHGRACGDRLWLYYNQPRRFPNFLVLKYIVSARDTSFGSVARALDVLDYIARLKHSDALLCEAANRRISARLIGRWGWVPHCPSSRHRHYIKRFYGVYPPPAEWMAQEKRGRDSFAGTALRALCTKESRPLFSGLCREEHGD
jgi:hypothetical protein